jgi:flagellin-like protein
MKKIWKIRKDSEAVSPVIATILMVAITVVLAAVLYVMVMGFGGPTTQTPTGSFTQATATSASLEKLQFGVVTPQVKPTELKIVIENVTSGTESRTYTFSADASGTVLTAAATGTITGLTSITYIDLAGDSKVSSGDYLNVLFGGPGTGANTYKVSMIYIASGNVIDDITFTT